MTETVYLLLFRGVGGATQLPTKPLKEALTEAGFKNAGTYINSGNAFLKTDLPRARMLALVADICREKFGFTKDIHAPSLPEWRKVVSNNPFEGRFEKGNQMHAAWLAKAPAKENVNTLRTFCTGGEDIQLVGNIAYLLTPNGFGPSKFAEKFDKGIGVPNTARNWNTVLKLLELGEAANA